MVELRRGRPRGSGQFAVVRCNLLSRRVCHVRGSLPPLRLPATMPASESGVDGLIPFRARPTPTIRCILNYEEALAYLYERIDYERAKDRDARHEFRLQRTVELFEKLGIGRYLHRAGAIDTPPSVPLLHIAGTKGKGSTATMLGEVLAAAGYRAGVYTSPHLTNLEERFRINGVACRPDELLGLVERVRPVVDEMDMAQTVSFFELTTAMSVLHFHRNDCEAIVLEVGLGGRLDSTNVCASSIAVITSIGLDHQRVLGNSRSEIAAEKAGIIKSRAPVVSGVQDPAAAAVIANVAARNDASLYQTGSAFRIESFEPREEGSRFRFVACSEDLLGDDGAQGLEVDLGLDGGHQAENAAVAIAAVRLMRDSLKIDDDAVLRGLARVRCAGRVERFSLGERKQVIVDTAHNEDSIAALCETLRELVANGGLATPLVVLFASSRDKDVQCMAARLSLSADEVVCTQFTDPPRFLPAKDAGDAFRAASAQTVFVETDVSDALLMGRSRIERGGTLVVCGSFFLAGEVRPVISQWAAAADSIEPACSGREP